MNVNRLKKYCRNLSGATEKENGHPSNILAFYVGNKKFAYFKTSEPERWRFSIRVSPQRYLELTDQVGIKPARYMHRFHWITVVNVASMDNTYLKELIDWSYRKAILSLPKKLQQEINS